MVGAFVGLFLVVFAGFNIYGALLGAMVACAALGVVSVFVAIRPVPKDRPLAPLISTIGLTIVLQNLAVYFIGGQQLAFPETIRQTLYHVGPITVSSTQLFILGVAVTLMLALWVFIEHSKMGRAIRAVAENHETAALLGCRRQQGGHRHLHHRLRHRRHRGRARRAEELEHLAANVLVWLITLLATTAPAAAQSPLPIIVLTDVGADPDDEQAITRLLHYANDFDVRGLIATRAVKLGVSTVRKDRILAIINAYEVDQPYLSLHDSRFPSAAHLRSVTKAGSTSGTVGQHSEGSVHIFNVVKAAADAGSAPVWVLIWGGPRELAQALAQARSSLSSDGYVRFKQKLRVYSIGQQYEPDVGVRILRENPDLLYRQWPSRHHGRNEAPVSRHV